jgi:uncharacterized protein (TIGR00251 family)
MVMATTLARGRLRCNVGQDPNTVDQPARIRVRLTPRAKRAEIGAPRADGTLPVRVTAPPVDGKANAALCKLLAERLGVAPSRVRVVKGHTARDKIVELEGVTDADLRNELNLSTTR